MTNGLLKESGKYLRVSDCETDHMMDGKGEKGIESEEREREREREQDGESRDGYVQDSTKATQRGPDGAPPDSQLLLGNPLSLVTRRGLYPSASGLDTVSASGLIGHQARSHHDHPPLLLGGEEGTRAES